MTAGQLVHTLTVAIVAIPGPSLSLRPRRRTTHPLCRVSGSSASIPVACSLVSIPCDPARLLVLLYDRASASTVEPVLNPGRHACGGRVARPAPGGDTWPTVPAERENRYARSRLNCRAPLCLRAAPADSVPANRRAGGSCAACRTSGSGSRCRRIGLSSRLLAGGHGYQGHVGGRQVAAVLSVWARKTWARGTPIDGSKVLGSRGAHRLVLTTCRDVLT